MTKHGHDTYTEILKLIEKMKKKEGALEKKVEEMDRESHNLHQAIDNMIITSASHYQVPCEYRKEGYAVVRCKKPPKDMNAHLFSPSCKYQWLHHGNVICISTGYKRKK